MAQADDSHNTSSRWWSLAQTLVWIIRRTEMPPRDAEQLANSPEMNLEIERALNELKREFGKAVLGMTEGMPIDKFRIRCGCYYVNLLILNQLPRSAEPGALSAAMHELQEGVRWPDVECNSDWLKRAFPAPASASGLATNTESSVAEPEAAASVDAMTAAAEREAESKPARPKKRSRKKRSRKKAVYRGAQVERADAVLKRMFKDGNYPAETEIVWVDLWAQFCEEYEHYAKDNPSKLPMPSPRTVRRALGWE